MKGNGQLEIAQSVMLIPISLLDTNDGQIDGVPENPRLIQDDKFAKLKRNIETYPENLKYNPCKVYPLNGRYVVLCGNMRLRAMRELQLFEKVPCIIYDEDTPTERLCAYAILDNNSFGQYDWDMLANEWDAAQLTEWGVDIPTFAKEEISTEDFIGDDELDGERDDKPFVAKLTFDSERDIEQFQQKYADALKDEFKCTISISGGKL